MTKEIKLPAALSVCTAARISWVVVAVYALLSVWQFLPTLTWPYVVDSPLMHYIAWRMLEGDAPYRDIHDMNFPMAYVHHMIALRLLGDSDLGWRAFTMVWAVGISVGAYVFCCKQSRLAGGIAALLTWIISYVLGPAHVAQRDFFLCLYLVWAAVIAFKHLEYDGTPPVCYGLLCGALLALGCWTKPIVAVSALGFGIYFLHRKDFRLCMLYVAGGAAVSLVMVGWLVWCGSFMPLMAMVFGYLIPIYSQYDRASAMVWINFTASWVLMFSLAFFIPRRLHHRAKFLLLLCGCGFLHYFLQGKSWGYHAYPMMIFMAMNLGMAVGEGVRHVKLGVQIFSVLVLFAACDTYLHEKPMEMYDYSPEMQVVAELKSDLPELKAQGYESVQILETANGLLHGLFRERVKNASPFMYDFMLLEAPRNDYTRQMREEFEKQMNETPPDSIIISQASWPEDNLPFEQKLAAYPFLVKLLATGYNQWKETDGYTVYVRRK